MSEYETRQFFNLTDIKPNNESDWECAYDKKNKSFTFRKTFDIYNIPVLEDWSKQCNNTLKFICETK